MMHRLRRKRGVFWTLPSTSLSPPPRTENVSTESCPADLMAASLKKDNPCPAEIVKLWSVSKNGRNEGQLRRPKDLCFFGQDKLAVSEEKNARIQFFDAQSGEAEFSLDKTKSQFIAPKTVCASTWEDFLLVADTSLVHVFDVSSRECLDVCKFDERKSCDIYGICSDDKDNVILSYLQGKASVGIYKLNGHKVRDLKADFGSPSYIAKDSKHIYVSDCAKHCVFVFDKHGKKLLRQIGVGGPAEERLHWPLGICTLKDDQILVADRGKRTISAYHSSGQFLYHLLTEDQGLLNPISVTTVGNKVAIIEEVLEYGEDKCLVNMYEKER